MLENRPIVSISSLNIPRNQIIQVCQIAGKCQLINHYRREVLRFYRLTTVNFVLLLWFGMLAHTCLDQRNCLRLRRSEMREEKNSGEFILYKLLLRQILEKIMEIQSNPTVRYFLCKYFRAHSKSKQLSFKESHLPQSVWTMLNRKIINLLG